MSGPHRNRLAEHEQSNTQDARLMRIALLAIAAYLFLGVVPVLRWGALTRQWTPLVLHVIALSLAVLFGLREFSRKLRPVRDWIGVVLVGFMYFELRFIGDAIGMRRKDDVIVALDRSLFHADLWSSLAQRMHSLPLSESLHFAYISYYAVVLVPPILLWRADRRRAFTVTALTLILSYVICFCISIAFPVDGPRFVHGPADAPSGPLRGVALTLLGLFSSRGSAFPSSHVAASVAASYCALRFQRRVGWVATVLTFGLAFGAIYGGMHYVTDIIAGIGVGGAAILVSRIVEGRAGDIDPDVPIAESDMPVNIQVVRARMQQQSARRSGPRRNSADSNPKEELPPSRDDAVRDKR